MFSDGADTVSPPGFGTMLSLEGLSRLARHVVRSYVASAPTETDVTFNWRDAVPGQVKVRLAPQYLVWVPDNLTKDTAPRRLDDFMRHLIDVNAGRHQGVAMDGVLGRIEKLVPGIAASPARTAMIALYVLCHRNLPPENHRDGAQAFIAKYQRALDAPSVTAFAAELLTGRLPTWSSDQWRELATDRRKQREQAEKSAQPLPPALDAALLVVAAEELLAAGHPDPAVQLASWAVEEMPGNKTLRAWEASVTAGQPTIEIDLGALILGTEATPEPEPEAGSGIDAKREVVPPQDGDQSRTDPNGGDPGAATGIEGLGSLSGWSHSACLRDWRFSRV